MSEEKPKAVIKYRGGSMHVPEGGPAHKLSLAGWRLISRKKRGMITMEQWHHPKFGTHPRTEALVIQRTRSSIESKKDIARRKRL